MLGDMRPQPFPAELMRRQQGMQAARDRAWEQKRLARQARLSGVGERLAT